MATRTREKGAARAESRDKRPQAHAKNIRLSSRKAKIVLDLIRGKASVASTSINDSIESHIMALAAERSRELGGALITIDDYVKSLN